MMVLSLCSLILRVASRLNFDHGSSSVSAMDAVYRRDHRRALHMHVLTFFAHEGRAMIAEHLRRARRELRDKVDDIDLLAMGVAA